MKSAPLFCLLFSLAIVSPASAQGESFGPVKATVRYLDDGSRLTTVIDSEARTAVETLLAKKKPQEKTERVLRKTTYLLDEKDLALGAIHYDANGNIRYKETFARDFMGHVVETRLSSADGRPLGHRVFSFNGDKPTGVIDYDANGNVITPKIMTTTRPAAKKK